MGHGAGQHVGHRLDAAMRVHGEARQVVARVVRPEMVEQQEGIEIVQRRARDAAFEPDARAFDDRLRLDDTRNLTILVCHFHAP